MSSDSGLEGLEQVARVLGQRWARRLRADVTSKAKGMGPWPGTVNEARELLDATLGDEFPRESLESLVSILERSARAAWPDPDPPAPALLVLPP